MSLALIQRVKELEKKVEELERLVAWTPSAVKVTEATLLRDAPQRRISGLNLCPKCGVKPAYFFHVKNCKGDATVA